MGQLEVAISVFSTELSVGALSEMIGHQPDFSVAAGRRPRGPVSLPKHNRWTLTADALSSNLEIVVDSLLNRVRPMLEGLTAAAKFSQIQLSVYGQFDDTKGESFNLNLSVEQLSFLAGVPISLDVSVRPSKRSS